MLPPKAGRAAIAALVLAAACAPPSETRDLAGTYVFSIATDTLRLDTTGHYTRVYGYSGSPAGVVVDSGRWRLSNNRRMVALSGLSSRWPEHGRYDPKAGTWHQPDTTVRRSFSLIIGRTWKGTITLAANPDFGWVYHRMAAP